MRLPVATTDPTPDGFTWTQEGELVMVAFTCGRDTNDSEPDCGCGRAFAGVDSHRATTRAVVRDVPMDLVQLRRTVCESLIRGGWLNPEALSDDDTGLLAEVCAEMVEIGEMFDEGTQLARYLDDVFPVAA